MNELPLHDPGAAPGADAHERERILDAALALAARIGWDAVHLHEVAREAGLPLAALQRHCAGKDALADAWFDRADRALLGAADGPHWRALDPRERLLRALLAWFEALSAHRKATLAMLRYKAQPDHPHLQLGGVLRVGRTVQWWREAALLPSTGWRREAEEAVLTAIFLGAMGAWWLDASPDLGLTRRWLERRLAAAQRAARWLPGGRGGVAGDG